MTLQEYATQSDPRKHPHVEVDLTEVTKGATITIAGQSLTQIWIIDGWGKEMWGIMYILKGNENNLWATDKDGNPNYRSCFHLKN